MTFTPIPDESESNEAAGFTTRPIRKSGETNILLLTEQLLVRYIEEGDDMLVSDQQQLVESLHRVALQVQRSKQRSMIAKLKKITKK